jgi:hypothetical protein
MGMELHVNELAGQVCHLARRHLTKHPRLNETRKVNANPLCYAAEEFVFRFSR